MHPNISNPRSGAAWSNEDDLDLEMSNRETLRKHQWQTVNNKRRRICSQTPVNITSPIHTTNRFESLRDSTCDISQNGMSTNLKTPNTSSKEPKPPPIYIYGVNNFEAMLDNLVTVTKNDTYAVKALPNDIMKIMPNTPETYRKITQHVRDENIIHHTYQLKQERAYRIVIRDLHHSIPPSDIIEELNKKGTK
jgi:hypothetical protein